jgi:hypothetical protein
VDLRALLTEQPFFVIPFMVFLLGSSVKAQDRFTEGGRINPPHHFTLYKYNTSRLQYQSSIIRYGVSASIRRFQMFATAGIEAPTRAGFDSR